MSLFVWAIAVIIAGTLDRSNERGNAVWMTAMLERSVAAWDDLDIVERRRRARGLTGRLGRLNISRPGG